MGAEQVRGAGIWGAQTSHIWFTISSVSAVGLYCPVIPGCLLMYATTVHAKQQRGIKHRWVERIIGIIATELSPLSQRQQGEKLSLC